MCKSNFAAYVNEMTPHDRLASHMLSHSFALFRGKQLRVSLDTVPENAA